jgi:hypothetical protein
MRDTPWHARPRAPEPPSATQPAPQQTTFRRLVIVNQELAQHNAKVRPVSFPPDARGSSRATTPPGLTAPSSRIRSCGKTWRTRAGARRSRRTPRRKRVSSSRCTGRSRRRLRGCDASSWCVMKERPVRFVLSRNTSGSAQALSSRSKKNGFVSLTSSRTRSSRLNLDQPGRGARGDPQAQDPGGRAGQSA